MSIIPGIGTLPIVPLDANSKPFVKLVGESWFSKIGDIFFTKGFSKIGANIKAKRLKSIVYPDNEDIFRAFRLTDFENVKVIILGKDPYHDGNADGLSFSCKERLSPSLSVIFEELKRYYIDKLEIESCGNNTKMIAELSEVDVNDLRSTKLDDWAMQGVLLLNSNLTVDKGVAGSHNDVGWDYFIKKVLEELIKDLKPKVFMLWGSDAQQIFDSCDYATYNFRQHLVIKTAHPMTEIYKRTKPNMKHFKFYGLHVFEKTNKFLNENFLKTIKW